MRFRFLSNQFCWWGLFGGDGREKAVGRAYATSAQGCVSACLENGQAGHGNSFTRDDCQFGSVNQILSNSTPVHIHWQRFYATIFEWACDDISIYCINEQDQKVECFKRWRNMTTNELGQFYHSFS